MSEEIEIEALSIPTLLERRYTLEKELGKVVERIVTISIIEDVNGLLQEENLKKKELKIKSISWDFYPESDDEGGSVYYPEGVTVELESGEEANEIIVDEQKYRGESLTDMIHEFIIEYSEDLYECDIYNLDFEKESGDVY